MTKFETLKPLILDCMVMRLSEKESMKYLSDKGFDMSIQHFYRLKKQIKDSRFDRLNVIAREGFVDQHLERIDQLELISKEYWKLYNEIKEPFKKALILEKIAELQTYISPYYDASRYVMEQSIKNDSKKETLSAIP